MAESYQLTGQHVRLSWRENKERPETTILRGQVLQEDDRGLWIWGRFFLERMDTRSLREVPRDRENEFKLFFIPWGSIEVAQIIQEKTRDYEVHQLILNRTIEESGRGSL